MWKDPIVEQIHKIRQEFAGNFNFDLKAMFEDLKEQEKKNRQRIVSLPIKRKIIEQPKSMVAN